MAEKNEKKKGFWQEFKAFITKGNVIDMAVGVVIGKAFSNIVTGLVNYIINPFASLFIGHGELDDIKTVLIPEKLDETGAVATKEVALLWGTWLQTILDFLIVAFCIFLVLRVIMHAKNTLEADKIEAKKKKEAEAKAKAEAEKAAAEQKAADLAKRQLELEQTTHRQTDLLVEIRDLLKQSK